MIERTFFSLVLVAAAAAAVLAFAEPVSVASAQATQTQPPAVIQLERVVITAAREDGSRVATATDPTASRVLQ